MPFEIRLEPSGEAWIALRGSFDAAEADRLHQALARLPARHAVRLDFRAVRLFHDSAIAQLARDLSAIARVSVVGLSEHHYRLLRYIDSAARGG